MIFKILLTILIFLLFTAASYAAWGDKFSEIYVQDGIDDAVKMALTEGANPDQIIKKSLPLKGMQEELLIKALFCALAQPDAIREAAKENAISDCTVDNGYQLALTECARQMEENLNSTIIQDPQFPELAPSKRIRRPIYGSPWKFN